MKLQFNGYYYADNSVDNNVQDSIIFAYNEHQFDANHFNDLMNQRNYYGAADYAAQYHFNDVAQQRAHENRIFNLRRQADKFNAIYSNAEGDDLNALDFRLNIFNDKGLEQMQDNNTFAEEFINNKRKIGGEGSKSLSITFEKGKRKLFGVNWLDWALKDNPNTFENFLNATKMSKDELVNAGVNIKEIDGRTILTFDKSNSLSNQLLYNISKFKDGEIESDSWLDNVTNFVKDGVVDYALSAQSVPGMIVGKLRDYVISDRNNSVKITGLDSNGNTIEEDNNYMNYNLYRIKRLIDKTKDVSEKYINPTALTQKVYSSTVGTFIEDGLEELRDQKAKGLIDGAQYKRDVEERYSHITGTLKSLGSANLPIYSNSFNDEATDETFRYLDNNQRAQAIADISAAEDFSLNSMISNGKIGTLVTIYATPEDKKHLDENTNSKDAVKAKRRQFFIPGLFHDEAQAAINRDSSTRTSIQLNDLQDYGHTLTTHEGDKIKHLGGNIYSINGKEATIEDAKKLINKDNIINDFIHNAKYQFMDNQGNINKPLLMQLAKQVAYNGALEINGVNNITTMDFQPIDVETIFNMRSTVGNNIANEYQGLVNYEQYKYILDIYNIYNAIIEDMNNFK